MKVTISPEGVTFIHQRGGRVHIFIGTASGCYTSGGVPIPMVDLGPPRQATEHYELRLVDGIMVYLSREAAAIVGEVEVTVSRCLWSRYLSVKAVNTPFGG